MHTHILTALECNNKGCTILIEFCIKSCENKKKLNGKNDAGKKETIPVCAIRAN